MSLDYTINALDSATNCEVRSGVVTSEIWMTDSFVTKKMVSFSHSAAKCHGACTHQLFSAFEQNKIFKNFKILQIRKGDQPRSMVWCVGSTFLKVR
jgi:hypothetical protein